MSLFSNIDIRQQLIVLRRRKRGAEEELLSEAKRILNNDLFTEKKILEHLGQYNASFGVLEEERVDSEKVFTEDEIREVAVSYRLKFLNSKLYRSPFPVEAVALIKELNERHHKDLIEFMVLAPHRSFLERDNIEQSSLFVQTNHGNYYLLFSWGEPLKWRRKIKYLPLRSFETLAITLILFTLILTLSLPTAFITLDSKATYWCGYRAAAFFHLLIFNTGVTIYFTFAFALNFSSSIWNKVKDFG